MLVTVQLRQNNLHLPTSPPVPPPGLLPLLLLPPAWRGPGRHDAPPAHADA